MTDCLRLQVPYVSRVSIDLFLRIGLWYEVTADTGEVTLTHREDLVSRPRPRVFAYDIETSKAKLKFPDADKVFFLTFLTPPPPSLSHSRFSVWSHFAHLFGTRIRSR